MYKILVVDDEEKIRALIRKYAQFDGYTVTEAADGMMAIEICRQETFDAIVMDVMMPELDGFSAVREIRRFQNTPVLMLSARGEEYDRIHGFELGADDYIVKPFSPRELMLRLEAVIKRSRGTSGSAAHEVYRQGDFSLDFTARKATLGEKDLELSPKEYELLSYLVRNRNIALSREAIITGVWGYEYDGDDRTLDTHIKLLRKALGPFADRISTLRSVGYRFEG